MTVTDMKSAVQAAKIDFNKALARWLARAQKIVDAHRPGHDLKTTRGKRYVRVIHDSSAFCFVDIETGDVLKAASWKTPAKHARGNIYTDDLGVTAYGAVYLK